MLGLTPTNQISEQRSFEDDVRHSTQHIRAVVAEALTGVGTDATRPQNMARHLGLDKNLAWKISRIVTETDSLATISHLPGRSGFQILLNALAKLGANSQALQSLRNAFDSFEQMVERHCGDRDTLDMMLSHLVRDGQTSNEESLRKKAFQGNSAVWGVQARVRFTAHFIAPAVDDLLDLGVVSGLVDFRRLRSDVPWAVATVMRYDDQGHPLPESHFEPIDPAVKRDQAPLIRAFCSDPIPKLRVTQIQPGVKRHEIAEGPVGNTAACTCITGYISRAQASRYRNEQDQFGEHMATLNTPAELCIADFFVHRALSEEVKPTVHLYSQLPGGPMYPQCGRDRGELPMRERIIELGGWPPDVVTPEVPNYAKLVALAASRMRCSLGDLVGYRIKMRYPPIPTVLVFRHELPPRP